MTRTALCTVALLLFAVQPLLAEASTTDPIERFKQYLNRTVTEVKETDDPAEKRARLNTSLEKMKRATERVRGLPGVNAEDKAALAELEADFSDKLDQLNGENDYEPVDDAQLDRFADYVQQDLEQAQRLVISISTTVLALIILLLLLL